MARIGSVVGPDTLIPLVGGGQIDLASRSVLRDGRVVARLTAGEAAVVAWLARHAGRDVAREAIAAEVLGQAPTVVSRAVDVAISRIRGKVEVDPQAPAQLITVQGTGYRWVAATVETGPSNVPPARDAVLGREEATARIEAALGASGAAVVTGPPGIGKTAVALACARERVGPGGVVLVELGTARDADDLVRSVAGALQIPAEPGADDAIGWAVRHRGAVLVVLDDVEAVASALAERLPSWRARAPAARWLLTALGPVADVSPVALGPLDPDAGVALFADRARAVRAGFEPTAEVRELVEALDGLPLAIELAAARAAAFSPAQLLDRLSRRLELLRRPGRERQATLRAAIEHSFDLLAPDEQAAFADLAAFLGPFDAAAATAVLGDRAPQLDRLVDRSMVVRGADGEHRLLESLRAFAAERLVERGADEAFRRHAAWALRDSADIGARFFGPDGPALTRRVAAESLELRGVVERFAERDPVLAARAVICARPGLMRIASDRVIDAHALLLADRLGPGEDDVRLGLLRSASYVLRRAGRYDEARARLLPTYLATTDPLVRARLAVDLGAVAVVSGRPAEALPYAEEGDALCALHGLDVLRAHVLGDRAVALKQVGRVEEATVAYARALEACERTGAVLMRALVTLNQGVLDAEQGRSAEAEARFREAVRLNRELGNPRAVGTALVNLGQLAHDAGDDDVARAHLLEALDIMRRTGSRRLEGLVRSNLAGVAILAGESEEASGHLDAALAIARQIGHARDEAVALGELGRLAWVGGDRALATERLREAVSVGAGPRDRAFHHAWLGGLLGLGGADPEPELRAATALGDGTGDPSVGAVVRAMRGLSDPALARAALAERIASAHVRFAHARLRREGPSGVSRGWRL